MSDMMAEGEEFYLDWDKDCLIGFQRQVNDLVVRAMQEGIQLKMKFLPVDVVKTGDHVYQIRYGHLRDYLPKKGRDGGHHRGISHKLEGTPLLCRKFSFHIRECCTPFDLISKMGFDYEESVNCEDKLRDSLEHLPRDVVERFCRENDLNVNKYLSQ